MTCANLGAFCEGELSAPDADTFRAHLPTCEACQRGLEDWMQIAAHASDALPRFEVSRRCGGGAGHAGAVTSAPSGAKERP